MRKLNKLMAGAAAALVLAGGYALLSPASAQAQSQGIKDCSANSIVKCGVDTPRQLIDKIRANDPNDLQAIYDNFRFTAKDYDAFARDAKWGTVKRDGTIVYNGQVVARNAWSIGRESKPYSQRYVVAGKTYHRSSATDVLNQDLPAMLWFNPTSGALAIGVIAACGNPLGGTSTTPSYRCDQLNREAVQGQANTYRFSANAPAASGASVSRVVYNFGDGSPEVTRTNPADAVTHTYQNPGEYEAKVTVYFKLPDGREVSASGNGCATRITVAQPPQRPVANWQCTALQAIRREGSDTYAYTFRANTSLENARLVSGSFDFGDGTSANDVTPAANATTLEAEHTYVSPGNYRTTATLHFEATNNADAQGKDTSVTCAVDVAIATPAAPAAPELPKTGVAGAAGLFAGTSALGALAHRWRASRRLAKADGLADRLLQR